MFLVLQACWPWTETKAAQASGGGSSLAICTKDKWQRNSSPNSNLCNWGEKGNNWGEKTTNNWESVSVALFAQL